MKTTSGGAGVQPVFGLALARGLMVALLSLGSTAGLAQLPPGEDGGSSPAGTVLQSWSFFDHTNWTSDYDYAPVTFTNLGFSQLGNFRSLVMDTNVPVLLQYHVQEADGTTNFTPDIGTVMFWFATGSWSGSNVGGSGPGDYARLFEVGSYTTNSSYGWWSLYVDPAGTNLFFSTQTNDLSGSISNYLTVPISWTTNYFHFLALTYSATNTALYFDGALVTNGPGVTVYPGLEALTNGLFIGSDRDGNSQAHGLFNNIATCPVPLDANTIAGLFNDYFFNYMINPLNTAMATLKSAGSSPDFSGDSYSAITGAGYMQWVTNLSTCVDGTNAMQVWLTNITATAAGDGSMNVTLTIGGGLDDFRYDLFGTGYLQGPLANGYWVWLGQGYHCNTYTVNVTSRNLFLILGTPQDTDGDGLTDAYETLVSHTDPDQAETDAFGVPYAWYVQNGLDPGSALDDPDMDGLLNYQEYQYGTKPQVSEGFDLWIKPSGITSNLP